MGDTMSDNFSFALTQEEKKYLKALVRKSIICRLNKQEESIPEPVTEHLSENYGAFVTLNKNGPSARLYR